MSGLENKSFQDLDHVNRIAKHLWNWSEYGQAAVMIGAGFSRLARPRVAGTPEFPLWSNLAEAMYGELSDSDEKDSANKCRLESNPLRLAGQYESRFGRNQLDSLLHRSIRDEHYEPGQLHKSLLSLPWSDVFTTNYDTLLERTRLEVPETKYGLIRTLDDIPGSKKPRIVKLHGSFPSNRPFVVTEEDFRTYPRMFAPFVNLVQQSLLENVFCLFGFSGTDPNFLNWSGWVRDNLGMSAPKIYLCGVLDLLPAERRYLEDRNIAAVDLGPLFPREEYGRRRYALAYESLLGHFHSMKPVLPMEWPYDADGFSEHEHARSFNNIPIEPRLLVSRDSILDESQIDVLLAKWEESRLAYPGWIVCPLSSRERLVSHGFAEYATQIFNSCADLPLERKLLVLFELVWRFRLCLLYFSEPLVDRLDEILALAAGTIFSDSEVAKTSQSISNSKNRMNRLGLEEKYFELGLMKLRLAREGFDDEQFEVWHRNLDKMAAGNSARKSILAYERCMKALYELRLLDVEKALIEWEIESGDSLSKLRKAAILAEIESTEAAEIIVKNLLRDVRENQTRDEAIIDLFSIEAWSMLLHNAIITTHGWRNDASSLRRDFRGRLRHLSQYQCDPWPDFKEAEESIIRAIGAPPESRSVIHGFDPGHYLVTQHIGLGSRNFPLNQANALVQMGEQGGLPIKCGYTVLSGKGYEAASRAFATENIPYAVSLAIRNKGGDGLDILERGVVVLLSSETVKKLYSMFIVMVGALLQPMKLERRSNQHEETHVFERILEGGLEGLSRIAYRLDATSRNEILNLAILAYNSEQVQNRFRLYEPLSSLFERTLFAMDDSELSVNLPRLLSLGIPGYGYPRTNENFNWPEPCDYVSIVSNGQSVEGVRAGIPAEAIRTLVDATTSVEVAIRERALTRLLVLQSTGFLDETCQRTVGENLCGHIDPKTQLPEFEKYFASVLLGFPSCAEAIQESLRGYFLNNAFPQSGLPSSRERKVTSVPSALRERAAHFIYRLKHSTAHVYRQGKGAIDWSKAESETLFDRAVEFWEREKYDIGAQEGFVGLLGSNREATRKLFGRLGDIVYYDLVPRMGELNQVRRAQAEDLLVAMEFEGLEVARFYPVMVALDIWKVGLVTSKVLQCLQSSGEEKVMEGILAVEMWALLNGCGRFGLVKVPQALTKEIVVLLKARRQPALDAVILRTAYMIRDSPRIFAKSEVTGLCDALSLLLEDVLLPSSVGEYFEGVDLENRSVPMRSAIQHQYAGAMLASAIFDEIYRGDAESAPRSILKWREFAYASSLPEVRKAFKDNSIFSE